LGKQWIISSDYYRISGRNSAAHVIFKNSGLYDDELPNLEEVMPSDSQPVRGYRQCKNRQKDWADRMGLPLLGSKGDRGEPAYTSTLGENLFKPIGSATRREFEDGDGDELKSEDGPPKMQAVHSSAALTVNIFDYWRDQQDRSPLSQALGVPADKILAIAFEAKRPIMEAPNRRVFPKDPNLDVAIATAQGSQVSELAIECKFTELYRRSEPEKKGLAPAYLREEHLWTDLPNCLELGRRLHRRDDHFEFLHATQLIRHILGLKHRSGKSAFTLFYLWYDVPDSVEADRHRSEIDEFQGIASGDGISFLTATFQQVIEHLSEHRIGHEQYVDYLVDRYT